MALEKDEQVKILKWLKNREFFCYKNIATNINGIPDIFAICYGRPVFIEVKRKNGKLTPLQEIKISDITASGGVCIVAYGFDNFMTQFARLFKDYLNG